MASYHCRNQNNSDLNFQLVQKAQDYVERDLHTPHDNKSSYWSGIRWLKFARRLRGVSTPHTHTGPTPHLIPPLFVLLVLLLLRRQCPRHITSVQMAADLLNDQRSDGGNAVGRPRSKFYMALVYYFQHKTFPDDFAPEW